MLAIIPVLILKSSLEISELYENVRLLFDRYCLMLVTTKMFCIYPFVNAT